MIVIWCLVVAVSAELTVKHCETHIPPEAEISSKPTRKIVQSLGSGFVRAIVGRVDPADYYRVVSEVVSCRAKQAIRKIWEVDLKQPGFAACFAVGILLIMLMFVSGLGLLFRRHCSCSGVHCNNLTPQTSTTGSDSLSKSNSKNMKLYGLGIGLLLCSTLWITCICFYHDNSAEVWPHVTLARDGILHRIEKTTAFFRNLPKEIQCVGNGAGAMIMDDIHNLAEMIPDHTTRLVAPILPTHEVDSFFGLLNESLAMQQKYLKILLKVRTNTVPGLAKYLSLIEKIGSVLPRRQVCLKLGGDVSNLKEHLRNVVTSIGGTTENLRHAIETRGDMVTKLRQNIRTVVDMKTPAILKHFQKDITDVVDTVHRNCDGVFHRLEDARDAARRLGEQIEHYAWVKHAIKLLILPSLMVIIGLLTATVCGAWGACGHRRDRFGTTKDRPFDTLKCASIGFYLIASLAMCTGGVIVSITFAVFFVGYSAEAIVCKPLFRSEDFRYLNTIAAAIANPVEYHRPIVNFSEVLASCKRNDGIVLAFKSIIPKFTAPEMPIHHMDIFASIIEYGTELERIKSDIEKAKILVTFGETIHNVARRIDGCRKKVTDLISGLTINLFKDKLKAIDKVYHEISDKLTITHDASLKINKKIMEIGNKASRITEILSTLNGSRTEAKIDQLLSNITNIIDSTLEKIHDKALQMFMNLGRCGALYSVYRNVGDLFCEALVDPINGVWFSMGMQLLALIPTVIFSLLLSAHFLAMSAQK